MAPTEHRELVRRLERALARGTRLLAVTRGLQTALTPVDVADVLTRHIRAASGAFFTGIALVDKEARQLRYLSMSPLPQTTTQAWQVIPLDADAPVAEAVRTGQAYFLESVEQAEARFPGIAQHMAEAGTRAMAHLPLMASNGRAMGTLAVSFAETRRISPNEREFLTTLAGYAAQAMERALLYEQQRTVAEALQGAVLPTALPVLAGWQVDGRFQSAAQGMEVGGDWYDAFTLPDGRLGCAVGDATGHGLAAARVMSSVRHALRAYAVLGIGPAGVLTRIDEMLAQLEPESLATVIYLELDPHTGAGSFALAGHPPMARCHPAHGTGFVEGEPDPPLGCTGVRPRHEHPIQVRRGELILLYTDGLIERRGEDLSAGLNRLLRATAEERAAADVPVRARHLLDAIVDRLLADGTVGDDVSVMTVHREGRPPRRVRADLASRPLSVSQARALTRRTLSEWGVTSLRDDVVLVVSELVTNAVTHAGTAPITFELLLDEAGLRVSVTDASHTPPELQDAAPGEEHGRGVSLVELLAAHWGMESTADGKRVWAAFAPGQVSTERDQSPAPGAADRVEPAQP